MGSPITIPGEGSPFIPPHKPLPPPPPKETSVLSFPLHKGQSRTHYKAKRIHRPHNPWRPEEKTSPRPEKTVHLLPNQSLIHFMMFPEFFLGQFQQPLPVNQHLFMHQHVCFLREVKVQVDHHGIGMCPAQVGEVLKSDTDQAVGLMGYFGFRFESPFLWSVRKVCSETFVAVKEGRYSFFHPIVLLVSGHPHLCVLFRYLPIDDYSKSGIPIKYWISQVHGGAGLTHTFLKVFIFFLKGERRGGFNSLGLGRTLAGYQTKPAY